MTTPALRSSPDDGASRNAVVADGLPVSMAARIAARVAGIDIALTPSAARLPCKGSMCRIAMTSPPLSGAGRTTVVVADEAAAPAPPSGRSTTWKPVPPSACAFASKVAMSSRRTRSAQPMPRTVPPPIQFCVARLKSSRLSCRTTLKTLCKASSARSGSCSCVARISDAFEAS